MPAHPTDSEGRFWCRACQDHHTYANIVTRHEAGLAAPGKTASAIVHGWLDAMEVAEGRQRKRCRQEPDPTRESVDDVPNSADMDTATPHNADVHDLPAHNPLRPAENPYAVPAAVLSSAATAWTQLGRVWIEEVPDESEINPTTGAPEEDEGEEDVDPQYYEAEDNDEHEHKAWVREMEDALRREMEDVGT